MMKITREHIESIIVNEVYWQPHDTTLTVCVLKLRNGTLVVGESACVYPENFDAEIGKQYARENAVDKIWAREGYLLAQRRYEAKEGV